MVKKLSGQLYLKNYRDVMTRRSFTALLVIRNFSPVSVMFRQGGSVSSWRKSLSIATLTVPASAIAAAPVYFDLGGLVLLALAVLLGLILLIASLLSGNRSLGAVGALLILVPLVSAVLEPVLKEQQLKDRSKRIKADTEAHRIQFAAFCSKAQHPVQLLSGAIGAHNAHVALKVKCSDDKSIGPCAKLDKELQRRFEYEGCKNTSVSAIYREFQDLGAPCCTVTPSVIVPICGSKSESLDSYVTHHLSTRVLRSEHHDGRGPMSRAHFYEVELKVMDAATSRTLATAVFFRSTNAGLDYKDPPSECPSFESTAFDLEQALFQKKR